MKLFLIITLSLLAISNGYKINRVQPKNRVADAMTLGEGPHWVADKQELLFVDIVERKVHRFIPATKDWFTVDVGGRVTPVVPVEGSPNTYVLGVEKDFTLMMWDGVSAQPSSLSLIHALTEGNRNRFNDGKCDPLGRLWAGTMDEGGTQSGSLYSLDSDKTVSRWVTGVGTSNGLTWSPDNQTFYYIDTGTGKVDAFNYDLVSGEISGRRTIFDVYSSGISGAPDGMTIDSKGDLWVCLWGGAKVLHIDPRQGIALDFIDFSGLASLITSAAFGGPNLDILYVTSANYSSSGDPAETAAGSLFEVEGLGVTGLSAGVPFRKLF